MFQDLMRVFPDAKVVLTVRSSESWRQSVENGILRTQKIIRKFPASWLVKLGGGSKKTDVSGLGSNPGMKLQDRFILMRGLLKGAYCHLP